MEISPKVLREVEFSGSLRGYNTDEVDEFLEQVAVSLDRLQAEARAAVERAESDRTARNRSETEDDETIRRTLILAQRTADLAVAEAREEAALLVSSARAEADDLIREARESAERLAVESEAGVRDEVIRLSTLRDSLEAEIGTLVSLLDTERARLTDSLSNALQYIEQSVRPSAEILSMPVMAPTSAGDESTDSDSHHESGFDGGAGESIALGALDGDGQDQHWTSAEPADPPSSYAFSSDAPDTDSPGTDAPATDSPGTDDRGEPAAPATAAGEESDDLEANIAEDAAKAAPVPRQLSGQYDWDSVARARSGAVAPEGGGFGRADLKAVPPLADPNEAGYS